ncbi:MAG: DUF6077 domain-containing protein [Clostridium sp.]|nr:DUF6077 domain-containing protein [Clostridium sp.]
MFFLKISIFVIELIIVPFLLGLLISVNDTIHIKEPLAKYIIGFFLSLALFWIICVPMTLFRCSFTQFVYFYSFIIICCCIFSICLVLKKRDILLKPHFKKFNRFEMMYFMLFILLLFVQLYFALFYDVTTSSYDDYSYITLSLDAITNDGIYITDINSGKIIADFDGKRVCASWPIFIAFLSKTTGVHVTVIAHTIMPMFFLLIAYIVYYLMAKKLFNKSEDRLIFLCIVSMLNIFGLYSDYSLTFRLLVALWQGKAIVSTIIIPFLIAYLPNIYNDKVKKQNIIYLLVVSAAACCTTVMGSGMIICVCVAMSIAMSVYNKRLSGIWYAIICSFFPSIQLILYLVLR